MPYGPKNMMHYENPFKNMFAFSKLKLLLRILGCPMFTYTYFIIQVASILPQDANVVLGIFCL